MIAIVLSLLGLFVSANGIQVKYNDCGNPRSDSIFRSIVILGCRQQPCVFSSQKNLDFEMEIILDETVSHFQVQIDARSYEYGTTKSLSTYTLQPPNCNSSKCKIRANDIRCIHPSLRLSDRPPANIDLFVSIYDQDRRNLGCAAFSLRVKDN
ncbi:uncharacterized protein LOC128392903 [Panonychus citri]|uniref:uncharacterized protein LOC128392903 n=1 Tax=Panonychus citri TaxID=50023 RepID=UPI0023070586|nr:uncharacterized protein LOC128392903 [Panonychus citri]